MIVIKIFGGLGNQLFQYAMARNVAEKNRTQFKMDVSWFERDDGTAKRSFLLDKFNIRNDRASEAEVENYLKLRKRIGRDLYSLIPFKLKKYVKMKELTPFDSRYLNVGNDVYLEGYWADERFFLDVAPQLRREITLRDRLGRHHDDIIRMIRSSESVSIHVRRGDYVGNDTTGRIFHVCRPIYYERAIGEIKKRVTSPVFFVFSDDIDWVRANLDTGSETIFVSGQGAENAHEDLILMSLCKHNIIANSTFSWWGAWLNTNSKKTVIAPGRWYNLPAYDGRDCIPPSWIPIPVE